MGSEVGLDVAGGDYEHPPTRAEMTSFSVGNARILWASVAPFPSSGARRA